MERIVVAEESEVLIGDGLLDGGVLLPPREGRRRAAVLTQPGAARLGRRVGRRLADEGLIAPVRVLPDGEAAKTLEAVAEVYGWLVEMGLTRDDTVVGVGGGALTDAAGFVAATYLRGIEAVYCPTTMLGAVDAAIGGKTGVNLYGKNLIGVFAHPRRVNIDTGVLARLTPQLAREGYAEAVKAGWIGDPTLVELFEEHGPEVPIGEMVHRAVAVKAAVVGRDFREAGERAILNYGHTVGHALERAVGRSHGDSIAIGMVAAGFVSERLVGFGEADRQRRLLDRLGLPTRCDDVAGEMVRPLLELDKKRDAGGLRMVLLRAIGDPVLERVPAAVLAEALEAVGVTGVRR